MRKVVDSNYLQSPKLERYLKASPQNEAILIDYVAMEAYKDGSVKSMANSMRILSKHPSQVRVLKGTQIICGIKPSSKGIQKRYIDTPQTRNFSKYCKEVELANIGNEKYTKAILEHGAVAKEHIDKMTVDAEVIIQSITGITNDYSGSELKIIRGKHPFNDEIAKKFINHVMFITNQLLDNRPQVRKLPDFKELANSYIFRYSLSAYLLVIDWISRGGAQNLNPKRMCNDLIDMHFVTYGTIFDGLLTNDNKAKEIYVQTKYLLSTLFKARI